MRVVIVHEADFVTASVKRIVESLCRLYPDARITPVGQRESVGADRLSSSSRRMSRTFLTDAELVVSTSCRAANLVQTTPGTLHICYLTELGANADLSPSHPESPPQQHLPLGEYPRMMASIELSNLAARPADPWSGIPRKGVTHFLAGSSSIAQSLRQETGRATKVISPPVAIEKFRVNQQQRRSDYYLMIAQAGENASLNLAVEACRLAQRRLVVLTNETISPDYSARGFSHVQFLAATTDEDVRLQMCGCRAVLSPHEAMFDPSVIEAQACGTPVIVPSWSDVAEAVVDAEGEGQGTGLFFDEPVPESLASAMLELERRPQKCSAALAWAQARIFSVERFEREMTWFLEAVCAVSAEHPLYGDVDRPAA